MARNASSPISKQFAASRQTNSESATSGSVPRVHRKPTQEAIRLRAFQIYEARGRIPGHDVDDWKQAERELRRNR